MLRKIWLIGISLNTSNGNTLSGNTVSDNSGDGVIISGR